MDLIMIRYGEMTLKKSNYRQFLKKIQENIAYKLKDFPKLKFKKSDYRFYVYLNGEDEKEIGRILKQIPGIASYSMAFKVEHDRTPDAIKVIADKVTCELNKNKPASPLSFKIETHRADKTFPMTSLEISQALARFILPSVDYLFVDVHKPMLTVNVEVRSEGTFIYFESIKCLGGFPSGCASKVLALVSGGIDSPVAIYQMLKKGAVAEAIHFASQIGRAHV